MRRYSGYSTSVADRRGSALAASLVVVMLMAMLSAAMLTLRGSMARRQLGAIDAKRAFYVAEAGLAEGAASISLGGNGNVGTSQAPARFGRGLFWTEAVVPLDGYTELSATALCGTARCRLEMVVRNAADPIGKLGLFGDQSILLGQSTSVTGIDSDNPVTKYFMGFPVQEPGPAPAHLASNASIKLVSGTSAAPTTVDGDLFPGPTGSVIAGINTAITGATTPALENEELPVITVPTLPSVGSYVATGFGYKTLPSNDAFYTSIRVTSGSVLTIHGPARIHASSLKVDAGGTLMLQAALGAIEIYVDDDLELAPGSGVSCPSMKAKRCTIYHTGNPADGGSPTLSLAATGSLYAKVFAPHLDILLPATLQAYGAVVGKSVTLADSAKFRYDVATAAIGDGIGDTPIPVAWRVVELPEAVAGLEHGDPITALGLDGATLSTPADAHRPNEWMVKFVANDGRTLSFVGKQTEFNWSKVASVVQTKVAADSDWAAFLSKLFGK